MHTKEESNAILDFEHVEGLRLYHWVGREAA